MICGEGTSYEIKSNLLSLKFKIFSMKYTMLYYYFEKQCTMKNFIAQYFQHKNLQFRVVLISQTVELGCNKFSNLRYKIVGIVRCQ